MSALPQIHKDTLSLKEFLKDIKDTIENKYSTKEYWVRGEISDFKQNHKSGHIYGEIIEYGEDRSKPLAKARIQIWKSNVDYILKRFKGHTGEELKAGMKVLLRVEVKFHEIFHFSFTVIDIDPSFTLGDREARKKQIIKTLTESGIIENNKKLPSPTHFTKVAVISSSNAAGLADFFAEASVLHDNNLCCFDKYQAVMQGEQCAVSIRNALASIFKDTSYDVIVIIRGGGSSADLDWFNDLAPAKAICSMQVPVYTGIGHQIDSCILDQVAHRSFDTPSKVISYIKNTVLNNLIKADRDFTSILSIGNSLVKNTANEIETKKDNINSSAKNIYNQQHKDVDNFFTRIIADSKIIITNESEKTTKVYKENIILAKRNISINEDAAKSLFSYAYNALNNIFTTEKSNIDRVHSYILNQSNTIIDRSIKTLEEKYSNISTLSKNTLDISLDTLRANYKNILSLSIAPTLERGFTLTSAKSGYITSAKDATKETNLTITYRDGTIQTQVIGDTYEPRD